MSEELKHECAVAMAVLRKATAGGVGDFGGTKLSLLLEKQHNRGQDGAGAAIMKDHPAPGEAPYWIAKSASATPLADVLAAIGKRNRNAAESLFAGSGVERIFLGHLRYATFGKNDVAFCHPFVHESSELAHTLLLAGNFNLTNARYLVTALIAKEMERRGIADAISAALANADGAWTLCGMTGDGWAFATRDPHGIRPGWYYFDDEVVAVASERPAIQAAFDVPPEAVKELPPGHTLVVSPEGEVKFERLRGSAYDPATKPQQRSCTFERIYFSRANDADIHRERKALGAALVPQILAAADAPIEDIFFSYIPNSARIAFHGLLEELINGILTQRHRDTKTQRDKLLPRFGEVAVKDAKFRTFIADAAARREFYKHVYDVTYGLVRPGQDTLVVLDDSIVRGNTMKNAILPMLDRLGPKRIVVASSAPPIRYPDCYGIDMSTLGELVAFKALVNLLNGERGMGNGERGMGNGERVLHEALEKSLHVSSCSARFNNPLAKLYARFTEEEHCAEIARLLTPPGMKAEVKVVYQTVDNLRQCLSGATGDWYFTGDYPTPGGYKVLHQAIKNYLDKKNERSY